MSRTYKQIILHHSGSDKDTPESIEAYHKSLGWKCCGYHYVIYDGLIYKMRPEYMVGAHCRGHNSDSIGICVCGDFSNGLYDASDIIIRLNLVSLIKELALRHPSIYKVVLHKDYANTLCPGRLSVLKNYLNYVLQTANDN